MTIQAWGNFIERLPPFTASGVMSTPLGTVMAPGSRVAAYVRSTGTQTGDPKHIQNPLADIESALPYCRSGYNDVIVVLPNHSQSVTASTFSGLVAGTRIVGVGNPFASNAPTFTFDATTSRLAVGVADVSITGCYFDMAGIDAVVECFDVTGAGFEFIGNRCRLSTTSIAAEIVMTLDTGANFARILNNYFYGLAGVQIANGILVSAAITDLEIAGNRFIAPGVAGTGLININAAALRVDIHHNAIYNNEASSTACITVSDAASSGFIRDNEFGVLLSTGAVEEYGINWAGSSSLIQQHRNTITNDNITAPVPCGNQVLAPMFVLIAPAVGATGVTATDNVVLTFDQNVILSDATNEDGIRLIDESDGSQVAAAVSSSTNTIIINPDSSLGSGTYRTIVSPGAIRSAAGVLWDRRIDFLDDVNFGVT